MIKRDKWYRVINDPLTATTRIDGIRLPKTVSLRKGDIAPLEYFSAMSPDRFETMIKRGDMQAYHPKDNELEILYSCYPATIPVGAKFKIKPDGIMAFARAWYQLNDALPYGLAALIEIKGICKVGDTAFPGDIVPAKFFAALSMEQFNQLEGYGLSFASYLESLAPDVRELFRPSGYLNRVAPNKFELPSLYEKFPAMNPEHLIKETIKEETQEDIKEGE